MLGEEALLYRERIAVLRSGNGICSVTFEEKCDFPSAIQIAGLDDLRDFLPCPKIFVASGCVVPQRRSVSASSQHVVKTMVTFIALM